MIAGGQQFSLNFTTIKKRSIAKIIRLLTQVALTFVAISADATTGGDAIIAPENQRQIITDWGFDIKEGGKAAALTSSLAQSVFVNDGMTLLRLPIYGNISVPAHPAPGVVVGSYYTDVLTAMTNARAANPNVLFFASKKSDSRNTYPSWVKDSSNKVIPSQYAIMVADFLQFMQTNGFTIDVLGIENEGYYTEDNMTPQQFSDTITALKGYASTNGFVMPARTIWPEEYNPDTNRILTASSLYGANLQIAGTHYYPDARPLSSLQIFVNNAGGRPIWHSEVHWGTTHSDIISQAEQNFATIFDCTDTGVSAFAWWSYTRTGIQGSLEQSIVSSTIGSRPVFIDDIDGTTNTLGTLITRAFRRGQTIFVWALNNTATTRNGYGFKLDSGSIVGDVSYEQWNTSGFSTGLASIASTNTFRQTLAANTVTLFTLNYEPPATITTTGPTVAPPGLINWWPFDGDFKDVFGNSDATPVGDTSVVNGEAGFGCYFDAATNTCLEVGATPVPPPWTACVWIFRQNTAWNSASVLGDTSTSLKLEQFNGTHKVGFTKFRTGDYSFNYITPTNTWVHLAWVGTATNTALYSDGVLEGIVASPINLPRGQIGADFGGNIDHTLGVIDEVMLFNRALSQPEIAAIYNSGAAGVLRFPKFVGPNSNGANQFVATVGGLTGKSISVFGSTNLTDWSFITNAVNSTGLMQFNDSFSNGNGLKFYKAAQQ